MLSIGVGMEEKIASSLVGLGAFGLVLLFAMIYAMVTPYKELQLIGQGNIADFSGACAGHPQ